MDASERVLHTHLLAHVALEEAVVVGDDQIQTPEAEQDEEHIGEVLAHHGQAGNHRLTRFVQHLPQTLTQWSALQGGRRANRLHFDVQGMRLSLQQRLLMRLLRLLFLELL